MHKHKLDIHKVWTRWAVQMNWRNPKDGTYFEVVMRQGHEPSKSRGWAKQNFRTGRVHTCQGPLSLMMSNPSSLTSTSCFACFTFFRYWIATSSNAPTASGRGYHFVGVCVQALTSFPDRTMSILVLELAGRTYDRMVAVSRARYYWYPLPQSLKSTLYWSHGFWHSSEWRKSCVYYEPNIVQQLQSQSHKKRSRLSTQHREVSCPS